MNERIIKIATVMWLAACLLIAGIFAARGASVTNYQDQNANNANSSAQNQNSSNQNMGGATPTGNVSGGASSEALSGDDKNFIKKAAMSGMKEVQLSQLAASQASNDAIRQFAQRMVTEHTQANQQLMQLATQKGVALPAADQKLSNLVTKMQGLQGAEFDKRYLKEAGPPEHEKAVRLYEREAANGRDQDLRSFAAAQLPALREHLTLAQSLAGTATGEATAGQSTTGAMGGNANATGTTGGNTNRGVGNRNANTGTTNDNANGNSNSGTPNGNVNR